MRYYVGLFAICLSSAAFAQPKGFNYDESKVPSYTLPNPLVMQDGTAVTDKKGWSKRRAELLELFREHVYGRVPQWLPKQNFRLLQRTKLIEQGDAFGGLATRKQIALIFIGEGGKTRAVNVLVYLPKQAKGPVPAFVGLNFRGNHTIAADEKIVMTSHWVRSGRGVKNNKPSEESRGTSQSRWQAKLVVSRGYALVTAYYGDIAPDNKSTYPNGVHELISEKHRKRTADSWGAIATWAWGLSRIREHLATDPAIDPKKIALLGHSRLGKTALWAGANDEHFAIVISNNSGCGGAALSRRAFGETVARINTSFPHWFCLNFRKYNGKESNIPVDQHQLIACIAPRPVYVASATGDRWADPRGEFLAAKAADPVYRLLTGKGLPAKTHPKPDTPSQGLIGYHLRTGKHDVTEYDWKQYLKFADKHFETRRTLK